MEFKINSFIKYKDSNQYKLPCGYAKIIGTIPGTYKQTEGLIPIVELPDHEKTGFTVASFITNYNNDFVKCGNINNYNDSSKIYSHNIQHLALIESVVDVLPDGSKVKIMHSLADAKTVFTVSKNSHTGYPGYQYKAVDPLTGKTHYINNAEIRFVVAFGKEKLIDNSNFIKMVSSDANDMMYRVAAAQLNKLFRQTLLSYLKKQGSKKSQLKTIEMLLDSEVGESLLSMILGLALTYAPGLNANEKAATLAEEFRISSLSTAGNSIVDTMMGSIFPVIMQSLSSINEAPQMEEKKEEVKEEIQSPLIEEILSSTDEASAAQMKA